MKELNYSLVVFVSQETYLIRSSNEERKDTFCEYCSRMSECTLIERRYQYKDFLARHGQVYLCSSCIHTMKKMGELCYDPHRPQTLVFQVDQTSQHKF